MVAKLDRLARSAQHALAIINTAREQGWNFVVLDVDLDLSTAQGRLFAQLLSSFAEFERELISTRTKEALAAPVRCGERNGRTRAIPAGLLRRIVLARDKGEFFARIAQGLTEERDLTPTGLATWHESTVRRAYAATQGTDAA